MNDFGINAALDVGLRTYSHVARASGRTTTLVNSVNTGDVIVFSNSQEAKRVQKLCKDAGKDVKYVVVEPHKTEKLLEYRYYGNYHFDHTWLEQYYEIELNRINRFLAYIKSTLEAD